MSEQAAQQDQQHTTLRHQTHYLCLQSCCRRRAGCLTMVCTCCAPPHSECQLPSLATVVVVGSNLRANRHAECRRLVSVYSLPTSCFPPHAALPWLLNKDCIFAALFNLQQCELLVHGGPRHRVWHVPRLQLRAALRRDVLQVLRLLQGPGFACRLGSELSCVAGDPQRFAAWRRCFLPATCQAPCPGGMWRCQHPIAHFGLPPLTPAGMAACTCAWTGLRSRWSDLTRPPGSRLWCTSLPRLRPCSPLWTSSR